MAGTARALVVFIPVDWAWVGMSMHANLHDVDRTRARLGVFAVGLCGLFMALALPEAYRTRGVLFGASYWAARLILDALMRGSYRGVGFNPFTAGAFVTGPLLFLGGPAHGNVRVAVWAFAAAVDLFVPFLARKGMTRIEYEPSHLPERFGLFLLIALGESVAETGVVAGRLPATPALVPLAGLVPALAAMAVLATLLVTLNAWEARIAGPDPDFAAMNVERPVA